MLSFKTLAAAAVFSIVFVTQGKAEDMKKAPIDTVLVKVIKIPTDNISPDKLI